MRLLRARPANASKECKAAEKALAAAQMGKELGAGGSIVVARR